MLVSGVSISKGASLQAGIEYRCRRSMGGHGEEGKDALGLAGRLSEQSPSRDCRFPICFFQSLSLCLLPSNKMVSYGGGWRLTQMTLKGRLRAVASEGMGKINF